MTDLDLWEIYKADFRTFARSTFNKAELSDLVILRTVLRLGGVYILPNYKDLTTAGALILTRDKEE